jgi:hypothetical protein
MEADIFNAGERKEKEDAAEGAKMEEDDEVDLSVIARERFEEAMKSLFTMY